MFLFDLLFGRTREFRVQFTDRSAGACVYQSVNIRARSAYDAARKFDTNYTEYRRRNVEEL